MTLYILAYLIVATLVAGYLLENDKTGPNPVSIVIVGLVWPLCALVAAMYGVYWIVERARRK